MIQVQTSPRIAVLTATYNRYAITRANIAALVAAIAQTACEAEIFLLDDASPDQTGPRIKTEFPQIHVKISDGNLYWNQGMRSAHREAQSHGPFDAYLLFNDDVTVDDAAFIRIVAAWAALNREAPTCLVGATQDNNRQSTTYSGFLLRNPNNVTDIHVIEPTHEFQPCDTFAGNFTLIPAAVFDDLGGLDPHFWHGFGDLDIGLSITRAGFHAVVAPGWIGCCDGHDPPARSRHGLLRRLKEGFTGFEDRRRLAYLMWKHGESRFWTACEIGLMLLKRLRVVVLNLPHVKAQSASARR